MVAASAGDEFLGCLRSEDSTDGRRRSPRGAAEGEVVMGRVTFDVAVSADGFSSRPDQSQEHPFGAGVDLHR